MRPETSRTLPWISGELANLSDQFMSYLKTTDSSFPAACEAFFASPISEETLKKLYEKGGSASFITAMAKDKNDSRFQNAEEDEGNKLIQMRTYKIFLETKMLESGTVLQSRFILSIKN